ncbi:hypothetical protein [Salisaeta longa]|uniref:hypothetical protein n=1 Tax=Salisaeta longa TaxID=503170 RepID=UPI0003B6006C|nr:hypothetical protein [Salisaeta longa]
MLRSIFFLLVLILISDISSVTAQDSTYVPEYELKAGTELVAVYMGAESCGPCHAPKVKQAIKRMKIILDQRAKERGWYFSAMGVAMDWKVSTGYKFLQENGRWDEVIVGKNWINLAVSRFLWSDSSAHTGIPQVVLLKRTVNPQSGWIELSEYQVLARHHGSDDISKWIGNGAPLPKKVK